MVSTSSTKNCCPDGEIEKYEIMYFYSYEEDPQNSPESLVAGYNLGQNKMEQQIRIPSNQG